MVSSGISDVAFASVKTEKTHLKNLMMMMIMKTFIITSNRKVMVDFKFDALYS